MGRVEDLIAKKKAAADSDTKTSSRVQKLLDKKAAERKSAGKKTSPQTGTVDVMKQIATGGARAPLSPLKDIAAKENPTRSAYVSPAQKEAASVLERQAARRKAAQSAETMRKISSVGNPAGQTDFSGYSKAATDFLKASKAAKTPAKKAEEPAEERDITAEQVAALEKQLAGLYAKRSGTSAARMNYTADNAQLERDILAVQKKIAALKRQKANIENYKKTVQAQPEEAPEEARAQELRVLIQEASDRMELTGNDPEHIEERKAAREEYNALLEEYNNITGGVAGAVSGGVEQYGAALLNVAGIAAGGDNPAEETAKKNLPVLEARRDKLATQLLAAKRSGDTAGAERIQKQIDILELNIRGLEASVKMWSGAQDEIYAKADALAMSGAEKVSRSKIGTTAAEKVAVDAVVNGVQMLLDLGLTGGKAVLPLMGVRTFGSSAQEVRRAGGDVGQQTAYGIAAAAVEVLTERMFDGLAGLYGAGYADDVVEQVISKMAKTETGRRVLRAGAGFAGEAFEEIVSAAVNPVIRSLYNGKTVSENYAEEDVAEWLYEGLIGGLLGFVGTGVEIAAESAAGGNEATKKYAPDMGVRSEADMYEYGRAGADVEAEAYYNTLPAEAKERAAAAYWYGAIEYAEARGEDVKAPVNEEDADYELRLPDAKAETEESETEKGELSARQINEIIKTPALRAEFEAEHGVKLAGTSSQMRAQVRSILAGEDIGEDADYELRLPDIETEAVEAGETPANVKPAVDATAETDSALELPGAGKETDYTLRLPDIETEAVEPEAVSSIVEPAVDTTAKTDSALELPAEETDYELRLPDIETEAVEPEAVPATAKSAVDANAETGDNISMEADTDYELRLPDIETEESAVADSDRAAGKERDDDRSESVLHGGNRRGTGTSARGYAFRVSGAESTRSGSRGAVANANARSGQIGELGIEPRYSEETNIPGAAPGQLVFELPEDAYDEEARASIDLLKRMGAGDVHIIITDSGRLYVTENGQSLPVYDVTLPSGEVWLVSSNRRSLSDTAGHVGVHIFCRTHPDVVEQFRNHIKARYKESAWSQLEAAYERVYAAPMAGVQGAETRSKYIWEEILGDAAAGMNNYGQRASTYQEDALAALEGDFATEEYGETPEAESADVDEQADARGPPRYSINNTRDLTIKEQLKEYRAGRMTSHDEFFYGLAPAVLNPAGFAERPIVLSQTDYKKSRSAKHNVPSRVMTMLWEDLADPILSFEVGNGIGVLTKDIDADGKPLLIGANRNVELDNEIVNRIKSAYGLDNPQAWIGNQIKTGKKLRLFDIERADSFLDEFGYKAERPENYRSGDIVADVTVKVNSKTTPKKRLSIASDDYIVGERTASWTPERIDGLFEEYASSLPNYSKAYATFISPDDFLSLTTMNPERIAAESRELDPDELQKNTQEIFLSYDPEMPGEVFGHEGRHRMVALKNAGIEKVAITVRFYGEEGKQNRQPLSSLDLIGQEFGNGRAPGKITLTDLVPISKAHRSEIEEKFGSSDSRIRYSAADEETDWQSQYGISESMYAGKSLSEDRSVYSYDFLTSLPDMRITVLPEVSAVRNADGKVETGKVVAAGMENARNAGAERDGKVFVQNDYTGRELRVDTSSIRHGLNGGMNRLLTNARLGAVIGDVVKNAVPINALHNKAEGVTGTYAMAAYATDSNGREFVAIVTVEQKGNRVASIETYDVTHAISGRQKKWTGSGPHTRPRASALSTLSEISISDFLDVVNTTHQSILSDDVLSALGKVRSPDGDYTGRVKYSVTDEEYMAAVEAGDEETVRRMVDEAAAETGYTEDGYHGTNRFGFTEFKREKSDHGGPFFFAEDEKISRTYTVGETREIVEKPSVSNAAIEDVLRSWVNQNPVTRSAEVVPPAVFREAVGKARQKLLEEQKKAAEILDSGKLDYKTFPDRDRYTAEEERAMEIVAEELAAIAYSDDLKRIARAAKTINEQYYDDNCWVFTTVGDAVETIMAGQSGERIVLLEEDTPLEETKRYLSESAARALIAPTLENSGIYRVKLKFENPLEVDADGNYWDSIPIPPEVADSTSRWEDQLGGVMTTRQIAYEAEKAGYDGVIIRNVRDNGGIHREESGPGTIKIAFYSEQIKSADPVTYDDDGNVIPLSKRFDTGKTDMRYSISETYRDEVDEWDAAGRPAGEVFVLGTTGDVLQGLGAIEQDIYINGDKVIDILKDHPEMTLDEIKRIPEILDDPVLVLKSRNVKNARGQYGNSRMVLFGAVRAIDGRPILCVMDLRPIENGFLLDDMQKVSSTYTKDNRPVEFVSASDVMYADKKRTTSLLRNIGFQMPMPLLRSGSIGSISYTGQNVNLTGVPMREIIGDYIESERTAGWTPERISDSQIRYSAAEEEREQGGVTPLTLPGIDPPADARSVVQEVIAKSEAARIERLRFVPKDEFEGTPALKKMGIKIEGGYAKYENVPNLLGNERAKQSIAKAIRAAEKRLVPTDKEKNFAAGLVSGIYSTSDIPPSVDTDRVLELADYYTAKKAFGESAIAWQKRIMYDVLEEKVGELFKNSDEVKTPWQIVLNNRTAQRNMLSMYGDSRGEAINRWLFDPVSVNESERIRFVNKQFDRVRKFVDSKGKKSGLNKQERAAVQMLIEGRAAQEIVAGMELGGSIKSAAENIHKGENAVDSATEFGLNQEEKRLAEQYARWMEAEEMLASDKVDSVKVENAVKEYKKAFDEFYAAINDFLVVHGEPPIGFIKGYAPHLQTSATQSLLASAFEKLGINTDVTNIPTSIAGMTGGYKPNRRWNPHFLQRLGSTTEYDIVAAYESYVEYMSDVFYHTDDIMKIRRTANYFRKTFAPEEIRNNIDWAETIRLQKTDAKIDILRRNGRLGVDSALGAEDVSNLLDQFIDELYKNAEDQTKFSNFVMYLDNYANILAGKQSMADRGWEYAIGRKGLNIGNMLVRSFARAQVAGNLSSAMNQTAQFSLVVAENGAANTARALVDIMGGKLRRAGFSEESDLLTGKRGIEYIINDPGQMLIGALFTPAEMMDRLMATLAVRSAYHKAIGKGMTHAEAMKYADKKGTQIMASRLKGSRPVSFAAKNPVSQMAHVFQVEVLNQWDHVISDLPRDFRSMEQTEGRAKAAGAVAGVIIKALISAFFLNRLDEELYGGTPVPFDFFGLTANFVASGMGMSTNAWLRYVIDNAMEKSGGERIFGTEPGQEPDEFDTESAFGDLTFNVMNEIPFARNLSGLLGWGDETLPIPDVGKISDLIESLTENGVDKETRDKFLELLAEFAPGGRQISKTAAGINTMTHGGVTSGYGDNQKLKYPVENTVGNWVRAVLFGKSGLSETEEFYASGEKAFTADKTALFFDLVASGADGQKLYDTMIECRHLAADDELTSYARARQTEDAILQAALTDEQKMTLYEGLVNAPDRCEKFRTMMDAGMTWDEVMEVYQEYAFLDSKDEMTATEQATDFARWLDGKGFSSPTEQIIRDNFKFWSMMPGEAARYDALTSSGVSEDNAHRLTQEIAALTPERGREQVSEIQKLSAITGAGYLSDGEKMAAIGTVIGTEAETESGGKSQWTLLNEMKDAGLTLTDFMTLKKSGLVSEATVGKVFVATEYGVDTATYTTYESAKKTYDADGNGSFTQAEIANAVDSLPLSTTQKAVLWQLANKQWKPAKNPFSRKVGTAVAARMETGKSETSLGLILP